MNTIHSLLGRVIKLESGHKDKMVVYCWIDHDGNHDEKLAVMKAKHPGKKIFSVGWKSGNHP